jgi:phosphatidylglycerol---prolipoprotein diacylglyceryl transferase
VQTLAMQASLAIIHWTTDPILFNLGNFSIRYYSLLFGMAFFVGYYVFSYIFKNENKKLEDLDNLLIYMFVAVVVGSRLGHCLFYDFHYYFIENPLEIFMPWKGGLASHGAAVGIFAGMYLFSRKYKYPYVWVLDRIGIVIALAGLFIRTGNFFNHEIVGMPTDGTWGVIFYFCDEDGGIPTPRIPVQLFEAVCYFGIFAFLMAYYLRHKGKVQPGVMSGWFLTLTFVARFIMEFMKESPIIFMGMKNGQLLSIPLIIIGIVFLVQGYRGKISYNLKA